MAFDLRRDALRLDLAPLLEQMLAGRPEPIRDVLAAISDAAHGDAEPFLHRMAQDLVSVLMVAAYLSGDRKPLYLAMFVGGLATFPDAMTWNPGDLPPEVARMADVFEPGALPGGTRADIVAAANHMLLQVEALLRGQSLAA